MIEFFILGFFAAIYLAGFVYSFNYFRKRNLKIRLGKDDLNHFYFDSLNCLFWPIALPAAMTDRLRSDLAEKFDAWYFGGPVRRIWF